MKYIVDNNEYIIGKDFDGRPVNNFQVHEIVKKIIFEIDRICRKNNIPYALSFGSTLGLYNYNGFIPWDDDGDIVIDYFDYDRFVEALKKDLGKEFYFDCDKVNDRFNPLIPAMKVRYVDSFIKEKNRFFLPDRGSKNQGIFVDVCLFMGVPSNTKEHRKLIRKSKLLMPLYVFLDAFLHINPKCIRKKLRKFELKTATKYKDSDYVSQTVIIPFQEHPKKFVEHLAFPKEVIYPFKEYDFFDQKIYSFNKIEEFCRLRYGKKALKIYDEKSDTCIDPFLKKNKKSGHLTRVQINLKKVLKKD